jgi:hypothetical protein
VNRRGSQGIVGTTEADAQEAALYALRRATCRAELIAIYDARIEAAVRHGASSSARRPGEGRA